MTTRMRKRKVEPEEEKEDHVIAEGISAIPKEPSTTHGTSTTTKIKCEWKRCDQTAQSVCSDCFVPLCEDCEGRVFTANQSLQIFCDTCIEGCTQCQHCAPKRDTITMKHVWASWKGDITMCFECTKEHLDLKNILSRLAEPFVRTTLTINERLLQIFPLELRQIICEYVM